MVNFKEKVLQTHWMGHFFHFLSYSIV